MEKMTYVMALENAINSNALDIETVEKLKALKDSYVKKAQNKKPTKEQEESAKIKKVIAEVLSNLGKGVTITELQKADERLSGLSNQRVSTLSNQLVKEGTLVKGSEKGKSLFSVA